MVQKRSYFARHHVTVAVASYLKGLSFTDNNEVAETFDALTECSIDEHLVDLTRTERLTLPSSLQGDEGEALDRHLGYHQYTTATILAQEDRALNTAEDPVPLFAQAADVDVALSKFEESNRFTLDAGQVALAKHLLQAGTRMGVGIGPAGTGKTTSMQIVADVWRNTGAQGCRPRTIGGRRPGARRRARHRRADDRFPLLYLAWTPPPQARRCGLSVAHRALPPATCCSSMKPAWQLPITSLP